MTTKFATSPDGKRIAYDCNGDGPGLVLVHGGGGNRGEWHEVGYIDRLKEEFTVLTLDLRGHGESEKLVDAADYAVDKQGDDILAVADANEIDRFALWGMSYGGNVGRYLAARSDRVCKFIMMGTRLGPGAPEPTASEIKTFMKHWPPILKAQGAGTLDPASLSEEDREFMQTFNVPVIMAWGSAMLGWPLLEPADFRCPTLWVVGSEDEQAVENALRYRDSLEGTRVQLHILDGLNHGQVMEEIDQVFPLFYGFTSA